MKVLYGVFATILLFHMPAEARQSGTPSERVGVYLDCQTWNCDEDEFRTEIDFVNWLRDRTSADVHLIMTSQDAGAGTQYVFDFIGLGLMEDVSLSLPYTSPSTATEDETLTGLVHTLKAGLIPFVARRGYLDELEIVSGEARLEEVPIRAPVEDFWNFWVFQVGGDLELRGEEREFSREFGADIRTDRTTRDWKISGELQGERYRREVELNDGRVFVNNADDWAARALVVRSVTNHLSSGVDLEVSTSTSRNRDVGVRTAIAGEWNLFPYEEANRRRLLAQIQLGYWAVRYEEPTIYERASEQRFDQRISLSLDTRQPWGTASGAVRYASLLNDWSKDRFQVQGGLTFRIFRGLDLDVDANYDILRDQLYLPAGGLTDEEILVQRRELQTGFEYELEIGLSYRFGSIFNNVVNNRFLGMSRGF